MRADDARACFALHDFEIIIILRANRDFTSQFISKLAAPISAAQAASLRSFISYGIDIIKPYGASASPRAVQAR